MVAGAIIVVALAAVALAFSGAFGRGDGNSVGGNSAKVTASAPAVALIATLAGKAGVEGSADGTGATARFAGAASITCDASDNLYVADTGNNTIRKITPDGMVTTLAGQVGVEGGADGTGVAAAFSKPMGITCDASGNLYVADTGNNTIRKVTPNGVVTTVAGKAGANDNGAEDADGTGATAAFGIPVGITCDAHGDLYVSDLVNSLVRKITSDGVVTTIAGHRPADGSGSASSYEAPLGITCDASGNVYAAKDDSTIREITPTGVATTFAGKTGVQGSADGTGSAARFNWPSGMTCDASGSIYLADGQNGTIRKITPEGVVTTIAVKSEDKGGATNAGGPGAAALEDGPWGIACDSQGNLYITTSYTICKIAWSH